MTETLVSGPAVAITLDIDWAPDFVIDFAADILAKANVRATWFITHQSPAVQRLRAANPLFEVGIHPNFLPGSTHGRTESEVLTHCMALAPEARLVRTHGLAQSSRLLERIVDETPIRIDTSLFLPHADGIEPVTYYWEGEKKLTRLPYVWEDDFEMVRPSPQWHVSRMLRERRGIQIFGFHPIHVYLNSIDLAPYRSLCSEGPLATLRKQSADRWINNGQGPRATFMELVELLSDSGGHSLHELAARSAESQP